MENKRRYRIIGIWTNLCRLLLAVVFIFSGFVKANDPLGMQYKIQDYLQAFGMISWVPVSFPLLAAIAMALHLYYSDVHDQDSHVITIKKVERRYSPWSAKIYGINNLVR